jgi:predicted patatin/cPLA2 family phospholipase
VTSDYKELQDHPVIEVLRSRRTNASKPGARDDGHVVALAVEGGGMRGIVSCAMLGALEDLGYHNCFDRIYGASSGSVNAAYFLAGGIWHWLSIYYDDLASKKFVDMGRLLSGRAVLDVDYAFDEVFSSEKPLSYARLIASPVPLHVAVTMVDSRQTRVFSHFKSAEDLRETLRASCWLPVAASGTAILNGERAMDGGLLVAHPYRFAIDDGATHVLSLSTRPIRPPRRRFTSMQRFVVWRLNRISPGLGDAYRAAVRRYVDERIWLQDSLRRKDETPSVLDVAPAAECDQVSRLGRNQGALIVGARTGYDTMASYLEGRKVRSSMRPVDPILHLEVTDESAAHAEAQGVRHDRRR